MPVFRVSPDTSRTRRGRVLTSSDGVNWAAKEMMVGAAPPKKKPWTQKDINESIINSERDEELTPPGN